MNRLQSWFYSKRVYLFDLDGTLYLGSRVLPGAVSLIHKLRFQKKKIFFFTNNSSRNLKAYLQKLHQMGFDPKKNEIIMSTHILISYLKKHRHRKIFLLGTPQMRQMLRQAGIKMNEKDPQLIVIGFDKTLTYDRLEKVCQWVSRGMDYIVTHPDIFCPSEEGPEPDCGAIAQLVEAVTGRKPVVVLGKPHRSMLDEVRDRISVKKSEMLFIGDRLATDIQMGHRYGIDTALVLSGDSQKTDLRKSKIKPTYVVHSVRDFLTSRHRHN